MRVQMEPRFSEYFRGLQQVFIYVTDDCELTCRQCLYKPWLRRGHEMPLPVAEALLREFRIMGAAKLSILGGEPTKYAQLPFLVRSAKEIGYEYIRLDTNGQFRSELLHETDLQQLDELTFSLDGPAADLNDSVRGSGSFDKCVENVKAAVALGYSVDVTCCVHRGMIGKNQDGRYVVEEVIDLVDALGVRRVNFHPLFRMGIPRDRWAGPTDISPSEWIELYAVLREGVRQQKYSIEVRVPKRFVSRDEFAGNPAYYGYCPVKMGERLLVHANGQIQICALMIGTPNAMARFRVQGDDIAVVWETAANELDRGGFALEVPTPCTHQVRAFSELVPLCISFKPDQDEFVWNRLNLSWMAKYQTHNPN